MRKLSHGLRQSPHKDGFTVKETQFGFVGAGQRQCIAHSVSGMQRQIGRTKNTFDVNHENSSDTPLLFWLFPLLHSCLNSHWGGLTTATEHFARAEPVVQTTKEQVGNELLPLNTEKPGFS